MSRMFLRTAFVKLNYYFVYFKRLFNGIPRCKINLYDKKTIYKSVFLVGDIPTANYLKRAALRIFGNLSRFAVV